MFWIYRLLSIFFSFTFTYFFRKQKSGGDLLAWMFKRPKVAVRYQEDGKEKIVDRAIYKMNLIGDEDEESSGVEEELKNRKRLAGVYNFP